jgi:ribonuclease D
VHNGPECKPQIEALRAECARIAGELAIPPSVLAPKAMLVAIARNNARTREAMQTCSGMMDWQVGLLEEPLRAVLDKFGKEN